VLNLFAVVRLRYFMSGIFLCGICSSLFAAEPASAGPAWSLQPNDRVVLLGNTFIERENTYGQIELALRLSHPEIPFSWRNLGWSGDNVLGESRAYFGPVQAGYAHLQEYVKLLQPTLLLVSYGHNAAYEGAGQVDAFLKDYEKLLDDLAAENRRIVILGLTPLEAVHRDAGSTRELNQTRQLYNTRIEQMCLRKQLPFVDLYGPVLALRQREGSGLTDNGVHLNASGYRIVGTVLASSLGKSLQRGDELLLGDSQFQAVCQPLLNKLLWKNELFFHRFRPQNETYLRGFRKHEQGQNAKEIYEFDALVEQAEQSLQPLAADIMREWGASR